MARPLRQLPPDAAITRFSGPWRFLSNFYPSPIEVHIMLGAETPEDPFAGGVEPFRAATVEHAFQALKTTDVVWAARILAATSASQARTAGKRSMPASLIRADWDQIRVNVMRALVKMKFEQHEVLAERLIATGDRDLVEGNTWGDRFWGATEATAAERTLLQGPRHGFVVGGVKYIGENWLGRILMERRAALRGSR